jgi:CRISPR/Cas system-associated endoribonuclease Cas2
MIEYISRPDYYRYKDKTYKTAQEIVQTHGERCSAYHFDIKEVRVKNFAAFKLDGIFYSYDGQERTWWVASPEEAELKLKQHLEKEIKEAQDKIRLYKSKLKELNSVSK